MEDMELKARVAIEMQTSRELTTAEKIYLHAVHSGDWKSVTIKAQFASVCGLCGQQVRVGELVTCDPTWTPLEWVHAECVSKVNKIDIE